MNGALIILWISFIITGLILSLIPYVTRKTENFGVSIPEEAYDRSDFKQMRKQYSWFLLLLLGLFSIVLGVLQYFLSDKANMILMTTVIILYLAVAFLLYLPFHFKMKKVKQQENWQRKGPQTIVVDTAFRKEKLIHPNWWFLLPGLLTVVTIACTFFLYDRIPDEIPMHEDFEGNIRYEPKSVGNLLFMPMMQIFMIGMFIIINIVIKHSKQQVSASNPEKSKLQNILFRRRWSVYTIISGILMVLLFSYIQFSFIYPTLEAYTDIVLIIILALVIIGAIFLSIQTGQGGSRIKMEEKSENRNIDRDDDQYWKLGQFYVNRNDPSIFVEKRFGVGWTNNWAHPLSWVFIIGIILIPLIISWILI